MGDTDWQLKDWRRKKQMRAEEMRDEVCHRHDAAVGRQQEGFYMMRHAYPCILKPETEEEGYEHWFNVSFPDVPEALTCGEGEQKSLEMAQDALTGALAGYVHKRREIPEPGRLQKGQ